MFDSFKSWIDVFVIDNLHLELKEVTIAFEQETPCGPISRQRPAPVTVHYCMYIELTRASIFAGHILKAGLDPGLWTLDFSLLKLYPPPKKPLYLPQKTPPQKKTPSPNKKFNEIGFFS